MSGSTFDRSIPAEAQTNPWWVSLMIRSPRRRTTRLDCSSTSGLWDWGSSGSTRTSRSSAFDTTFWLTTRTSPSSSPVLATQASMTIPARSSPGRTSGRPGTGRICSGPGIEPPYPGPPGTSAAHGLR